MERFEDYKKANEYSLKCMRVTLIVMIIGWILNSLDIFILDQGIMNHALIGLTAIAVCGYLVKFVIGFEKKVASYLMLFLLVGMITYANVELAYHGTLFMLFPMVCSILYNENRYIRYTFILTCLGFLISVVVGFRVGLCDANMLILTVSTTENETAKLLSDSFPINNDIVNLVLFYVVPRCMGLVGFTSVLDYLKKSIQEKSIREQESIRLAETERLANQAKSRFLAQMSHEIRTPINAVLGMNEMILHKSKDREITEYSSNIKKAGKTLLVLINSILDFSKIEDGKMELLPVNYVLKDMVDNLRIAVEQRAKDKGLDLIIKADPNLPGKMYGDDLRISQIIINLLTNAVKYTKEGAVTLEIKEESRSGNKISLLVRVADTGIGIREEEMPRLFASFERLDENRNRTIEGTGLGLAITTRLLEMMGSRLQVESKYGEGSVFYFTLSQDIVDETPMGNYDESSSLESGNEETEDAPVFTAPFAKILVVDDNEMNLKVIDNLLGLFGIRPDLETSGSDAISIMRQKEYDIVFMDHMMPEMDGIETLQRLRKEKLVPDHTVVIALTANAIVGSREIYLAASFNDYLTKPIEMDRLSAALDKYLPEEKKQVTVADDKNESEVLEFSPEDFVPEKENRIDDDFITKAESIGIRAAEGLRFCGKDRSFYRDMLREFASSCDEKSRMIQDRFDRENWKEYKIYVHALKSTSRSIGADDISEQARMLEEAVGKGESGYIKERHSVLMGDYKKLAEDIRNILN